MSLSTDASAPGQWTFPAGVNISSNGYLVVWCDNSSAGSTNATTNLNTGFSLAGGGGGLYLFKTNGQMADFIVFGPQITDASIGISAGAWSLLSSPTPGLANSAAAPLGNPANLKIKVGQGYHMQVNSHSLGLYQVIHCSHEENIK